MEIDLIGENTLTQIKRVASPDAHFGRQMREQFEWTVDAAREAGYKRIRYIVAEETPEAFAREVLRIPLPEDISLIVERIPARK